MISPLIEIGVMPASLLVQPARPPSPSVWRTHEVARARSPPPLITPPFHSVSMLSIRFRRDIVSLHFLTIEPPVAVPVRADAVTTTGPSC
ncbi:hypothetical protein SGR_7033t [Streptomyces griseus subsp. griseus NBRC 13350]|uniref:Uncharacterized protein n=1 Tax=Streptomyces griseus subsp. griseus (strain JCM 4626 / CBS 651.72 / NBRC 13350 / KCC S-0626 / ISP 5235) TaxID=455632 RepID=B1VNB2_STRGG|nr:hypothetical protein SGR_106t [Streptomyces griseus subsp. griseus NBRC 13350]BAG23860.1 hypothetical protein SGR_7033t [Streptomyces griseus subsp. griseus NBRC 13350]